MKLQNPSKFYFSLFLFWLSFTSGTSQCDPLAAFELIQGRWHVSPFQEKYVCYNPDSTYDVFIYGDAAKIASGLTNVDTISPWGKGERGYFLSCSGDTLMLNSFYLKNWTQKDTSISYILSLSESELIRVNFKKKKGLEDHIDGVGLSYRDPDFDDISYNARNSDNLTKSKYFLKPGFQGYVVLLYGGGVIMSAGGNEEPLVVRIPDDGLFETYRKADPVAFVKQQHEFYFENDLSKKLPIVHGVVRSMLSESTLVKEYLSQFDENEICVVPFGYNQFGREMLNKKFGKDLQGNAEIYYVGPLKEVMGKFPKLVEE